MVQTHIQICVEEIVCISACKIQKLHLTTPTNKRGTYRGTKNSIFSSCNSSSRKNGFDYPNLPLWCHLHLWITRMQPALQACCLVQPSTDSSISQVGEHSSLIKFSNSYVYQLALSVHNLCDAAWPCAVNVVKNNRRLLVTAHLKKPFPSFFWTVQLSLTEKTPDWLHPVTNKNVSTKG